MPLNVVGEFAKVVSISFRLFGNIMGGSIIIIVVSYLAYGLILPPFLYAFFGLFVGTIQAFVFTVLTLVYIAVQIR
jgi:F-type H+-transporting ATPase subunit a